ncbi:MAG: glutamine amidotransferase-related protein [Pseudomonadales bacterium]
MPQLRVKFGNYPEMIIEMLSKVEPGWTFDTYQVHNSKLPVSIDECDAYITTGSRHSVNDEHPWMLQLEEFVQSLDRAEKKYVGICFGHQLMVKALGGNVERSEKGWGIGVSSSQLCVNKQWMLPNKGSLNLVVSHQDQVCSLPEATEVLARNDFCPRYMLQRGKHMMTVQGHPEFTADYSRALMDARKHIIPASRIEEGVASLGVEIDSSAMAVWIAHFIKMASA